MGAGTGIPNIGSSAIGDPIGKAVVELILDDKAYEKGLKKSEKGLNLFDKKTQKIARRAGIAFTAGGAAITAALSAVIFQAAKAGDELDKMSLRTGVSVENLSRLSFAAQRSGSDITALETSLRFLARRMDESSKGIGIAKEVFDDLGVSITDQEGVLRSQPEVIKDVATAISNLESETKQVAAAMDIFGARSGPGLLPLLKQGEEGIQALMDRADELGIVISTEAAAASAEFADRLLEMTASLKMAGFELGQTLLPAAEKAIIAFTEIIAEFNKLDDGTKKVIGYTAAIAGLTASIIGPGLLVISRLEGITKGFRLLNTTTLGKGVKGATATFVAGAAVLFAYNEIMKAARDETVELRGEIEILEELSKDQAEAIGLIEAAMTDAREQGIDPFGKSLNDLGVDVQELNETLQTQTGIIDRFVGEFESNTNKVALLLSPLQKAAQTLGEVLFGVGKSVEGTIPGTVNAEAALGVLQTRMEDNTEEAKRLKAGMEGAADGIDDAAGAADTATKALEGMQKLMTETRQSIGFLSVLAGKPILPHVDPVLPKPGEAGILAANITAIVEAEKATAKLRKELEDTRGETDFSFLTTERRLDDEENQLEAAQKRIENFNDEVRREGEARAGKTLSEFREFLREQEKEREKARKQVKAGFDKAKKDDEKSKAERLKAEEKLAKETLDAQARAAAEVLAAWERTADEIQTTFADLFDDILDPSVINKFELFWKELAAIGRRQVANIFAQQLFALDDSNISQASMLPGMGRGAGQAGQRARQGMEDFVGPLQEASTQLEVLGISATHAVAALNAIPFLQQAQRAFRGAGSRQFEPFSDIAAEVRAEEARQGGPIASLNPILNQLIKDELLRTAHRQGGTLHPGQAAFIARTLTDQFFAETGQRATFAASQSGTSIADLEALGNTIRSRNRQGFIANQPQNRQGGQVVNGIDMAPGAPGRTVIVNVDKLADSMPIVFPDITKTTPKEIADIAATVVVPAMKTAIKRGIFNRSIES